MFYKRTDIEVLCETLLKLVDKHDQAVKRNGVLAALPHQKSIEVIMKKIEVDLAKPIIGVQSAVKTSAKKFLENGKNEMKRFSGIKKKSQITMMHGAPDDMKIEDTPKTPITGATPPISPQIEKVKEEIKEKIVEKVKNNEISMPTAEEAINKLAEAVRSPEPKMPDEIKKTIDIPPGTVTPDNIDTMADKLAT